MKVSPKQITNAADVNAKKEVKADDSVNFNLPPSNNNNISLSNIKTQISNVNNNSDNNNDNNNHVSKEPVNIVKVYNLHKTYLLGIEGVPALRGVSLNIQQGHFVMLLGKSGSGKTSLLNLIGTIDQPTRGDLEICGVKIKRGMTDACTADLRLNHLGFVFQTFNLIGTMTALENVLLPTLLKNGKTTPEAKAKALELLRRVGMSERAKHYPSQLSGGEQQRITIARALVNTPSILLLDEPTGDLDTKNTENIMRLLLALNLEGVTMIMVTHDPNLKSYAHRCIHMMDGRIYNDESISSEIRERAIKELGGFGFKQNNDGTTTTIVIEQQEQEQGMGGDDNLQSMAMNKTELRQPKDFYSILSD